MKDARKCPVCGKTIAAYRGVVRLHRVRKLASRHCPGSFASDAITTTIEGLIYAAERAANHNAADNAEWFAGLAKEATEILRHYRAAPPSVGRAR